MAGWASVLRNKVLTKKPTVSTRTKTLVPPRVQPRTVQPLQSKKVSIPAATPKPQAQQSQFGGWAHDPAYDEAVQNFQRQLAQLQSNNDLAGMQDQTALQGAERQAEQARKQRLAELEARMADQGIIRSGINVGEQAEVEQEHQSGLQGLNEQYRALQDARSRDYATTRQGIQTQIASLNMDRARRQSEYEKESAMADAEAQAYAREEAELARKNDYLETQVQEAVNKRIQAAQPKKSPTGSFASLPRSTQQGLASMRQQWERAGLTAADINHLIKVSAPRGSTAQDFKILAARRAKR